MVDLGSFDFYIGTSSIPQEELERYSSDLFDKWEAYITAVLELEDFSISLEIEDGSIEGKGKLGTKLKKLAIGIGIYGSFINGLYIIKNQVSDAGSYLIEEAQNPYKDSGASYKTRRRTGNLGQLERLFYQVQNNKISIEKALDKAESIFGDEIEEVPEFMDELKKSFEEAPRIPEQMSFESIAEDFANTSQEEREPKRQKPHSIKSKVDPSLHNRIQIWRESKDGKKKILITQI